MDLTSPAPQRAKAPESLTIQPGSIRTPATGAASEFARHLAENNQTDSPRRRDDRPAERRERPEPRNSARRDDEIESRASARDSDKKNEEAEGTPDIALTVQVDTTPGKTVHAEDAPVEAQTAIPGTEDNPEAATSSPVEGAENDLPSNEVPTEMAAVEAEAPVGTAAAPVATAEPTAPEKPVVATGPVEARVPAETSKPQTPADAAIQNIAANPPADGAGDTKAESTAQKGTAPAAVQQTAGETAVVGDAAEPTAEFKAATIDAKTSKGLGHNAAEQLAEKKTEAKQTLAQAAAAPQTAPSAPQAQRAAAQANQPTPLATGSLDTVGTPRGGDLPVSGTPSTGGNGSTATVRIGTLPGQAQPTQLPATTIALQMARNLQKGISRFDIRLDPPEMGRIDVRMEVRKDGHVAAHMTVDRPETLDLLQRDARALQQALNNAGLQADSDSLNFTLRDQSGDGDRPNFADGGGRGADEAASEELTSAPIYNVNLSANGGIDIRV
ncbi:MAG: flagellar hook-length control protein FliK [Parvibaculum sp.]|uniref:flagellar hook-length control protein FliK n=2 Tax=Parvibaculum sp. TaxID=2024848 RepID=UPI00272EFF7D|nr:flagellar hook-length control protein FliK [Parvibaculum sp.]MDP1628813.1 flagellar hook-length control protein FliK [Parvibaculum sp.]MDP2148208.1 flagellar hook-length control protein FliK [Parvibaculum sp.]